MAAGVERVGATELYVSNGRAVGDTGVGLGVKPLTVECSHVLLGDSCACCDGGGVEVGESAPVPAARGSTGGLVVVTEFGFCP